MPPQKDDNLGPVEEPFSSASFQRNLSVNFLRKYETWNTIYQPFKIYPYTPWDESLPKQFAKSSPNGGKKSKLGGKFDGIKPEEQFTIVILTYKRENILLRHLRRLHRLPYLNKIVIVWNGPNETTKELDWPDISPPVHVRTFPASISREPLIYDYIWNVEHR